MKKLVILFIFITLLFTSCRPEKTYIGAVVTSEFVKPKKELQKGDIIYLKLDSTECIVNYVYDSNIVSVYYKNELGDINEIDYLRPELIHGLEDE